MKPITFKIVNGLSSLLFPMFKVSSFVKPWFKLIHHYLKCNGTLFTVKHLKLMRLHVTRFICGQPLFVNDGFVSVDKDGWPTKLRFMRPLVDTFSGKKFLLTLLMLTRSIKPKSKEFVPYSTKSITSPYIGTGYTLPQNFVRKVVRDFGLKGIKPSFKEEDVYLSLKAGPNGPATLSVLTTIKFLPPRVWTALFGLLSKEGLSWFSRIYDIAMARDTNPSFKPGSPKNIKTSGRLSIVKDPECKMRIIGIVDYITQVILTPIHNILFDCLRKFPSDRTFTQDPHFTWASDSDKFWSIDLSSATDRFPISFQEVLLASIFNDKKFAYFWKELLVGRSYVDPDGNPIFYEVGQPMGAKSSWPAFTLCHHVTVQWCAFLEGMYPFSDYIMLGDDIVIKNDNVARRYLSVMKGLGVETSESKTHVSIDTYEFAKRWFHKGKEITGLPLRGIIDNIKNPFIVWFTLFDYFLIKKNSYFGKHDLNRLVASFFVRSGLINSSVSKLIYRIENYSFTIRYLFGISTNDELRSYLCKWSKGIDLVVVPSRSEEIRSVIERAYSDAMVHVVQEQLLKIYRIFDDVKKLPDILDIPKDDLVKLPIFTSIFNRVKELVNLQDRIEGESLRSFIETILILDIESVTHYERRTVEVLLKAGKLTRLVRKNFQWLYVSGMHSVKSRQIVQATKYLVRNFETFISPDCPRDSLVLSRKPKASPKSSGFWLGT